MEMDPNSMIHPASGHHHRNLGQLASLVGNVLDYGRNLFANRNLEVSMQNPFTHTNGFLVIEEFMSPATDQNEIINFCENLLANESLDMVQSLYLGMIAVTCLCSFLPELVRHRRSWLSSVSEDNKKSALRKIIVIELHCTNKIPNSLPILLLWSTF